MKRFTLLAIISLLLPVVAQAAWFGEDPAPQISTSGASFSPAFSPVDDINQRIVDKIDSAKKSICIASQLFNSKAVAEALVNANRAGKNVRIVLDKKSNSTGYSTAFFLLGMGIKPHLLTKYDSLYANYIVIDESDVIIGNITGLPYEDDAKRNPASVLIIQNSPELAKQYLKNWELLWNGSEELKEEKKH